MSLSQFPEKLKFLVTFLFYLWLFHWADVYKAHHFIIPEIIFHLSQIVI